MAAKKRSGVSVTQFIALIVATVTLSLVVDLGRKLALYRRLQLEEVRLDQGIELEEARRDYLESLKEQVQSDEFVGAWARREWRMVKPGEVGVVPLLPQAPAATQIQPQEESHPSQESRLQEWWRLLFD